MNEERIFDKLDSIEAKTAEALTAIARCEEQLKDLPDHEIRLRSLEKWRYGLPIAGLTAVISAALSAWSYTKGS